jgi:predicted RNA-binding protein
MDTSAGTGYWLLITSRSNWCRLQVRNEWAFSDKSSLLTKKIHLEDRAIVYLGKEGAGVASAIGGSIRFIGKPFRLAGGDLFDQVYPIRVPTKVTRILEHPVPFRPLVPCVEFIANKRSWGSYFQGRAAIKMAENDFLTLHNALETESEGKLS